MKQLLIILSFLLLSSPLFGQSEETCYVAADSSKDFDRTLLSNISVSLISEFLKEVEPIPPAGISMNACVYQISAVKRKDTTFVTFTGKNLNSIGISKLSEPDGFQESLLKALYIALEDKRKLICDAYGEYIEKCGGVVKKIPAEKIETCFYFFCRYFLNNTPTLFNIFTVCITNKLSFIFQCYIEGFK